MAQIDLAAGRFGVRNLIVFWGPMILAAGLSACAGNGQSPSVQGLVPPSNSLAAPALVAENLGAREGLPDNVLVAPARPAAIMAVLPALRPKQTSDGRLRPFSRFVVSTNVGTLGFGVQITTPLACWLNLSGGFDLGNIAYGFTQDGVDHNGTLQLRSGSIGFDLFPFHSGFHVSPGLLIFNGRIGGSLSVPGGNSFDMGGTTLSSNAANPVAGTENLVFTRSIMPMLTIGFHNAIRRETRHWSVPLELGAAYTGHYSDHIKLLGSACYKGLCVPTSNANVQASVLGQQNSVDETMKHYQVFPIVVSGVSYRF